MTLLFCAWSLIATDTAVVTFFWDVTVLLFAAAVVLSITRSVWVIVARALKGK
jgi:hypothetical protein